MRISDWSSDVCSSDLIGSYEQLNGLRVAVKLKVEKGTEGYDDKNRVAEYLTPNPASPGNKGWVLLSAGQYNTNPNATQGAVAGEGRSEEHTSELQSLMRISYAAFCLKQKRRTKDHTAQTSVSHKNRKRGTQPVTRTLR